MVAIKHGEDEIADTTELDSLLTHLRKTTSQVEGITYNDISFVKGKKESVLFLGCKSEDKYLEWREICPPPPGAKDWCEVLFTKHEHFS